MHNVIAVLKLTFHAFIASSSEVSNQDIDESVEQAVEVGV